MQCGHSLRVDERDTHASIRVNTQVLQVMGCKIADGQQINPRPSFIIDLNEFTGQKSALTELIELRRYFLLASRHNAHKRQRSLRLDGDARRRLW